MSNLNFGGLPKEFTEYKSSKIAIYPIAFDKTASWLKGANKGPEAIIEASHYVELYDIETDSEVYQHGITTLPQFSPRSSIEMIDKSYENITSLLGDEKFAVTLGGDHSVAIAPIKAHYDFYKDISILHLDAHADRRTEYENNKYNHACVIARAQEYVENIVSVGIRSMDVDEKKQFHFNNATNLFLAEKIYRTKDGIWIDEVLQALTNDKIYLTIDVDVFEIGLMPSTGTPEPGGLNWYQVIKLLNAVCQHKTLVGCDVVELAPSPTNKAPDFMIAKMIYKLLSYKFCSTPLPACFTDL